MIISATMDLDRLAETMGDVMTVADAAKFREALVAEFDGVDTRDVPDARWQQLMAETCQ